MPLTRRGQYVVRAALALALVASVLAIMAVLRDDPPCSLTSSGATLRISTHEAELAATAVAEVIHEGGDQAAARKRIVDTSEISADDAGRLALAFGGRTPAVFSCTHGGSGATESDALTTSGLTGRADALRQDLRTVWPGTPLGGFEPGGVSNGHMEGSAHYEGRAIDAFFRPINDNNRRLGWAMAQYYVAHADRLAIETVIFDDRIWTARRADEGWRDYHVDTTGKTAAIAKVLEHRDHVHVDVAD